MKYWDRDGVFDEIPGLSGRGNRRITVAPFL